MRHIIFPLIIASTLIGCSTANKMASAKPQTEADMPALNAPVTRKIWIPDKLDSTGTRLEKGHWLFLIERQSTWSN